MSKPAEFTHRIRPKAGNAKWEHVSDESLAAIKEQVGPRTFAAGYQVEKLAEKPEKLAIKPGTSKDEPTAPAEQK